MMTPPETLLQDVQRALAEDIGDGDVTADLVPEGQTAHATLITRETMVMCGRPYVEATFAMLDPKIRLSWDANEGQTVQAGERLCVMSGSARAILSGERTALNFLQLLSAIATKTRQLAALLDGTPARLYDTRKTLPGLRLAQKYAVVVGGGQNHRMGLYDQVLIKENHIAAAGSITLAVAHARARHPTRIIQVEVENEVELREAFACGPDIIMLDNFNLQALKVAVTLRQALDCGGIALEASGNITATNLREVGFTGVDRISLGTLTKDISAVDLSLRVEMS